MINIKRTLKWMIVLIAAVGPESALTGSEIAEEPRAHIPGKIPDGTPPPPAPAKPVWIVPAADILSEKSHVQGGRTITVREIKPIALPPPPDPSAPAAPVAISEELRAKIDAYKEKNPRHQVISFRATIYRLEDQTTRTHLQLWSGGGAEPVSFWSSGDFSLLSGIGAFTDKQGVTRALFMVWSMHDMPRFAKRMQEIGRDYTPPEIPELPADRAAYVINTGDPDEEMLSAIDAIHEILTHDAAELRLAYEGRVRAAREREEFLKANPPQPKDLIINYWRVHRGEGGGK